MIDKQELFPDFTKSVEPPRFTVEMVNAGVNAYFQARDLVRERRLVGGEAKALICIYVYSAMRACGVAQNVDILEEEE